MDSLLEMDYEDKNGGIVDYNPFDDDEDDYDEDDDYDDSDEDYLRCDSPSIEDTISEWPSYAN